MGLAISEGKLGMKPLKSYCEPNQLGLAGHCLHVKVLSVLQYLLCNICTQTLTDLPKVDSRVVSGGE